MLRAATPADVPAAFVVVRAGFETYRAFAAPGWEPPAEALPDLSERLAGGWGVVAQDGGRLVGFGGAEPARESPRGGPPVPGLAHVWAVFVAESHWGTGVAAPLLEALVAESRRRGFEEGRLFTAALHRRARRFYAREGWTERGAPVWAGPLGLDVVELRRPL